MQLWGSLQSFKTIKKIVTTPKLLSGRVYSGGIFILKYKLLNWQFILFCLINKHFAKTHPNSKSQEVFVEVFGAAPEHV